MKDLTQISRSFAWYDTLYVKTADVLWEINVLRVCVSDCTYIIVYIYIYIYIYLCNSTFTIQKHKLVRLLIVSQRTEIKESKWSNGFEPFVSYLWISSIRICWTQCCNRIIWPFRSNTFYIISGSSCSWLSKTDIKQIFYLEPTKAGQSNIGIYGIT